MHDINEKPSFLYQLPFLSIRMINEVENIKIIGNLFEIECFIRHFEEAKYKKIVTNLPMKNSKTYSLGPITLGPDEFTGLPLGSSTPPEPAPPDPALAHLRMQSLELTGEAHYRRLVKASTMPGGSHTSLEDITCRVPSLSFI